MSEIFCCVHGHFYQPDRTDPWTGEVEREDSAAPFHDWNERVNAECYRPNAQAKLPGSDAATSNYERMSFNFGPSLLAWLELHDPETCAAVIAADRDGRARFSGHGPAICQSWGHSILPLDSERDRRTQLLWGIRDFEHRFGRAPEGAWLPETAVSTPVLEACAELGLRFTILAPHQAAATRPAGAAGWTELAPGSVDPRRAYRCLLPSGRDIALFFYDGPVSRDIAFGTALEDGRALADRLVAAGPGLAHVAVDGETFGHHHRFGELALAACLDEINRHPEVELTVYAEHLERFGAADEVRIVENSSWSCVHGIERWRSDCGCSAGNPGWNQAWRAPLRRAVEWLRDAVAPLWEKALAGLATDPWAARDDYVSVLLDPTARPAFVARHCPRPLDPTAEARLFDLLEVQRLVLRTFTSCAWFFDDITEPATLVALRSACRAMELATGLLEVELEPGFVDIIYPVASNVPGAGSGADVWRRLVRREAPAETAAEPAAVTRPQRRSQ
ncbi:DUF3536 domain-containing protein [candidate division WOR-3 bacterium]|nr:DUF3536 domain-containing protein [candidate division WOR-3 bacterium]